MSITDRLQAYFQERPNVYIDGLELAGVAGAYGWRTRCSELRRQRGMTIENKQVQVKTSGGQTFTRSLYRYVPPVERQGEPTADVNAWSLT